jgi:DNA-directed RNA polymerase I, II, and III subunit RPABC2
MSYSESNSLLKNLLNGSKKDDDEESEVENEDVNDEKSDIGAEETSDIDDGNSDVEDDDDDDDVSDIEDIEEGGGGKKKVHKGGAGTGAGEKETIDDLEVSSSDEEEDDDDDYLQKFNQEMKDDLILNFHPESKAHNYEEIKQLAKVTRNKNGIIVDELHKTIPILTKYEKTRILGQRTKQIESGGATLVQVPPNVIDSYLIAKLELEQNKIPFIIRRPLPNGGMEYWYVSDLDNL